MGKKLAATKNYGGFWLRFAAAFLDFAALAIISVAAGLLSLFVHLSYAWTIVLGIIPWVLAVLYESYMTSRFGGTLGKLLLKLEVFGPDGKHLTLSRSFGRYFAKFISYLILFIGVFMIGWTEKKQGLHDKIVGSIVVRRKKSVLSASVKRWVIAGMIVSVVLYAMYMLGIMITGLSSFAVVDDLIAQRAPVERIVAACDNRTVLKENCYTLAAMQAQYLTMPDRVSLCLITQGQIQGQCIAMLGFESEDANVCIKTTDDTARLQCTQAMRMMHVSDSTS